MAVPVFVGAGTGAAVTTGTGTVSKATCTAGNLLLMHMVVRGATQDWSDGNGVNIQKQDGTTSSYSQVAANAGVGTASRHNLFIGRVTANGTCSFDVIVGASGEDIFARMYEFSGVLTGGNTGTGTVENGPSDLYFNASDVAVTSIPDRAVQTLGADRLALQFVGISTNQNIPVFTGMTGGTWAEAAEFDSGTGALASLQLQTADMPSTATIDGGACTVTTTDYGIFATALIPAVDNVTVNVTVNF